MAVFNFFKGIVLYFVNHIEKITTYTIEHFILIIMAILLSLLVWTTVGIAIRNRLGLAKGILSIGSFVMSIPSIALYGILVSIPGFGLSRKSAVFGLLLYAMLPIVRNVYIALNQVDKSILEAARGMGMSSRQVLFKVQLPLALPVIMAGVRVALVMMVGIATLAVYIGERNLGRLIQQGIVRTHDVMIIVGAILVSLMAVAVDYIMGRIQKIVISPGLSAEIPSNISGKKV
ncbi:MAG: ABC transporter permease [Acetivibrionales bacterium]|jgi:osmoprotectant transport system permease protein